MPYFALLAESKDFLARSTFRWEYAHNCFYEGPAMIQDKSAVGLGVQVPKSIPLGASVSILQAKNTYHGIVRHCSESKARCPDTGRRQFLIEIEFVPAKTTGETKWVANATNQKGI